MKFLKIFLATLIIALVTMFFVITSPGCKSNYKPIAEEQLQAYPECIFALNTFKAYEDGKDKSGVVLPGKVCLDSIKRQKCIREIWNNKAQDGYYMPDWTDVDKKREFASCMIGL